MSEAPPLRVVVAEDEVMAREKLVHWIEAEPDLRVPNTSPASILTRKATSA